MITSANAKVTVDQMVRLLSRKGHEVQLPCDFLESAFTYMDEVHSCIYRKALQEGEVTNSEAEARAVKSVDAELARIENKYIESIVDTFNVMLEEHGLEATQLKTKPWLYSISPIKDWKEAAAKILNVINGVGYFQFNSLREFIDSGPYTPRTATLSHLHWMVERPNVYGSRSYDRMVSVEY